MSVGSSTNFQIFFPFSKNLINHPDTYVRFNHIREGRGYVHFKWVQQECSNFPILIKRGAAGVKLTSGNWQWWRLTSPAVTDQFQLRLTVRATTHWYILRSFKVFITDPAVVLVLPLWSTLDAIHIWQVTSYRWDLMNSFKKSCQLIAIRVSPIKITGKINWFLMTIVRSTFYENSVWITHRTNCLLEHC